MDLKEIDELIKTVSKFPGLGPKSAKRRILKLINNKDEIMKPAINALVKVYKNISKCNYCGVLKSSEDECNGYNNCDNLKQRFSKICVVENISDQWSIQSSNIFSGYYHILGGTISGKVDKSQRILIDSLVERVKKQNIEEVIVATSATVEGQTTAFYIQDAIKNLNVKISRLGQGIPIGGEIENLDDGTLNSAFKSRREI